MKRTIIALAVLGTVTAAHAQQTVTGTKPAATVETNAKGQELRAEEMAKQLGLSAEQTTKVAEVLANYDKNMAQLNSVTMNETDRAGRAASLRNSRDKSLQGVFTAEQFEKLTAMRKETKAATMQRRDNVKAAPATE